MWEEGGTDQRSRPGPETRMGNRRVFSRKLLAAGVQGTAQITAGKSMLPLSAHYIYTDSICP